MANVVEEIEEEEKEEPKSSAKYEEKPIEVTEDEGEYVNCVVQKLLLSTKQKTQS